MIDSISKFPFTWQFFFRAFFLFAILKGRNVELRTAVVIFVLLMLLPQLLSLMWLPLQPPSLSLSLLLFLPLLAAVDAFGFISSEWNWFFSKAYRINGKYMYKEQIGDYFDFFSLISFCFFFLLASISDFAQQWQQPQTNLHFCIMWNCKKMGSSRFSFILRMLECLKCYFRSN